MLLGLLAFTAWLPGGLTNGVAMLRQPTSVVLSTVSALAVGAAGLVLVRVRVLPWWGLATVGVLALYGVAAFAVAAIEAAPYPSLFQGGSLWTWLPSWLQGATLGALVAVPFAIAMDAFHALKRHRIAEEKSWRLQQGFGTCYECRAGFLGCSAAADARNRFSRLGAASVGRRADRPASGAVIFSGLCPARAPGGREGRSLELSRRHTRNSLPF